MRNWGRAFVEWLENVPVAVWLGVLGAVVAGMARWALFPYESGDFIAFLSRWYEYLDKQGLAGLGDTFSSYPPSYLYFLWGATLLPLPKLYAIKLISMLFDYSLAVAVTQVVRVRHNDRWVWVGAFVGTLFLPTLLFNSALWGQCDVIFTSFLVWGLYYILRERSAAAMVCLSLALCFKPQAIFFAPAGLVLLRMGRLKWEDLWIGPAVYLVVGLPAIVAGRSVISYLLHYVDQLSVDQGSSTDALTLGATNWYIWVPDSRYDLLSGFGWALATGAVLGYLILSAWAMPRGNDPKRIVRMVLLSVVLTPYCLPGMHERYFFAADVMAWAYVFFDRRAIPIAVVIQAASWFTYLPYLFEMEPVPRPVLSLGMTAALVWLVREVILDKEQSGAKERRNSPKTADGSG